MFDLSSPGVNNLSRNSAQSSHEYKYPHLIRTSPTKDSSQVSQLVRDPVMLAGW